MANKTTFMKNKDNFTNIIFHKKHVGRISAQFDQASCTPRDIGSAGYRSHGM